MGGIQLVYLSMGSDADVDKLMSIYNDLQSLMKYHLDMIDMVEKRDEGLDQIEIASETILDICQRLEQCPVGKNEQVGSCCSTI